MRRYAGKAAGGAVDGGKGGNIYGAAVGAAKGVAVEAAKDGTRALSKMSEKNSPLGAANKVLGAGGTSFQRARQQEEHSRSRMVKGLAVGGAATAAPPAVGLVMLMALLNWLKSMFFAMLAMAMNAMAALWAWVVGVVKTAVHAIFFPAFALGGLISNIAGLLGFSLSTAAAAATAGATGLLSIVTGAALFWSVISGATGAVIAGDSPNRANDSSCTVDASTADGSAGGTPSGGRVSADTTQNAKRVFSVLKTWGMPEDNIAGVLGNWSRESGIDPTSVEGVYDEPYHIGPKKQAAEDGNFTQIPGQEHGGIGLGQWSNGRTTQLLDYASSKKLAWYKLETQLAFMVQADSGASVFKKMFTTDLGSPKAAAVYFHNSWERSADDASMIAQRAAQAQTWFGKMSGWKVDQSVADNVSDVSGGAVTGTATAVDSTLSQCKKTNGNAGPGSVNVKKGGMNEKDAKALISLYNKEGDKFLDQRYGANGGPGSCGSNHAENCVSFSTYFVNKYTKFQTYPQGNGIKTAYVIAQKAGKQMSDQPAPYSVGSGPGSGAAGHTLVVLGVQGSKVIVGEAAYCEFMGRVRITTASALQSAGWKFVDMSDQMLPAGKVKKS